MYYVSAFSVGYMRETDFGYPPRTDKPYSHEKCNLSCSPGFTYKVYKRIKKEKGAVQGGAPVPGLKRTNARDSRPLARECKLKVPFAISYYVYCCNKRCSSARLGNSLKDNGFQFAFQQLFYLGLPRQSRNEKPKAIFCQGINKIFFYVI